LAHHATRSAPRPATDATTASGTCDCDGRGTCRSCGQRRAHAWRLVETEGLSPERAAERMRLTPDRVRLLVEQERDKRELEKHKRNRIRTDTARQFVDYALAHDPDTTLAELAHFLDMRPIDLKRQLGYEPGKNGKTQQHVDVTTASRIVIALGRAPHELDGC